MSFVIFEMFCCLRPRRMLSLKHNMNCFLLATAGTIEEHQMASGSNVYLRGQI